MFDHLGREWLRAQQIAERIPQVRYPTLKVWVHRGKVRSRKVGRERWICVQDVAALVAEQRHRERTRTSRATPASGDPHFRKETSE